ncbi:oxidation resistance protein 1 [Arthroderma uncinatum]|uniref:oxidation resistance protein 1 n=1 Tax=Arthroderma uncinatum TaxID=74035 RepID=UPI00144AB5EE|nr:oxidation resistance protein 1 [Arthroderma uncinatum]KAF3492183.1 oxidation resistance protein 1 [Arthroderma uncinatum]
MAMTLGKDVSSLFPDVLKNIATADLDQKKLVYLYLIETSPETKALQITPNTLRKMLMALNECTEWGRVSVLTNLANYTPKDQKESENICERVVPQFQHINASVVLAAVKVVFLHMKYINPDTAKSYLKKMAPPLVTLVSSAPEVQYVALRNIDLLLQSQPNILDKELRVFFCKYNDPPYLKFQKLEIMVRIANDRNVDQLLAELKEYALDVDMDFVRRAVKAIGQTAIKIELTAEKCVATLLDLINTKVNYVVQEAIVVIKDIFRKYPGYEGIIPTLCQCIDELDEPDARGALIWIVGEYAEKISNAGDILAGFVDGFNEEFTQTQLQILTAVVKLFLKRPDKAQGLVQKVLRAATEEIDNPDIRDRAYVYWRLLSNTSDPNAAKNVVLSEKPPIVTTIHSLPPNLLEQLLTELSTLASVYHKPPEQFIGQGKYGADAVQKAAIEEQLQNARENPLAAAAAAAAVSGSAPPQMQNNVENLLDIDFDGTAPASAQGEPPAGMSGLEGLAGTPMRVASPSTTAPPPSSNNLEDLMGVFGSNMTPANQGETSSGNGNVGGNDLMNGLAAEVSNGPDNVANSYNEHLFFMSSTSGTSSGHPRANNSTPSRSQQRQQQYSPQSTSSYLTYPVTHVVSGLYRRLTEPGPPPSISHGSLNPMSNSAVFTPPRRTASPFHPPPLTPLTLESSPKTSDRLLTRSLAEEIRLLVPPRLQLVDTWKLVYNLDRDGASLSTLYDKCREHSGLSQRAGYLLVVRDTSSSSFSGAGNTNSSSGGATGGSLFGAYLTDPPHPDSHYYGTGECFLWRASTLSSTPVIPAAATNGNDTKPGQSLRESLELAGLPPPPSADTSNVRGRNTTFRGENEPIDHMDGRGDSLLRPPITEERNRPNGSPVSETWTSARPVADSRAGGSRSGTHTPEHIRFKAFPYSGVNDYMIFCETGFLSVGGGDGHYGLWLDDAFEKGISSPSLTFGNEPLSDEGTKFDVLAVEVWSIG